MLVGRGTVQYLCCPAGCRSHCAGGCVCHRMPAAAGEPVLRIVAPAGQDRPDEHREKADRSEIARGHGRQLQRADSDCTGEFCESRTVGETDGSADRGSGAISGIWFMIQWAARTEVRAAILFMPFGARLKPCPFKAARPFGCKEITEPGFWCTIAQWSFTSCAMPTQDKSTSAVLKKMKSAPSTRWGRSSPTMWDAPWPPWASR